MSISLFNPLETFVLTSFVVTAVVSFSAMLGILGMFASENIHGVALWETQFFS